MGKNDDVVERIWMDGWLDGCVDRVGGGGLELDGDELQNKQIDKQATTRRRRRRLLLLYAAQAAVEMPKGHHMTYKSNARACKSRCRRRAGGRQEQVWHLSASRRHNRMSGK